MRSAQQSECERRIGSWTVVVLAMVFAGIESRGQDATPQRATGAETPPGRTHAQIKTNPMLSLHMLVRAGAAGAETPACIAPAIEAMRAVGESVNWGMFDAMFAGYEDLSGPRLVMGGVAPRLGRETSDKLLEYIDALESVEPAYRAEVWPEHEEEIQGARAGLEAALKARGHSCVARICELLGMTDPGKAIPVYLVASAPAPGGFTGLFRQQGAVCIVSIDAHQGSALVEATLHEAIHALDVHTSRQEPPTVLQSLRKALADAGVSATDARMRDVPHTLIFAAAAEVTREVVDPSHVAYGESGGYYAKVPEAAEAVLPAWEQYVSGKIDAAGMVVEVVKAATRTE